MTQEETDWDLCAICPKQTTSNLQCPANTKRKGDAGAGYYTLATNLIQFYNLGNLPPAICLSRLDDGEGIQKRWKKNKAKWHKSCYNQFNSTELRRAKKRHSGDDEDEQAVTRIYTRSCSASTLPNDLPTCFLCNETGTRRNPLHKVETIELGPQILEHGLKIRDEELIAKLSKGTDLVALEGKYHSKCLTDLYKRAELVSYIEESDENVFKLADISKMYKDRLEQLGIPSTSRVNSTRLKERLLAHLPDLEAYSQGRDVYLAFREELGKIVQKAQIEESDETAVRLAKAAKIVNTFNGNFNCQKESVPKSLLALVNMLLYGPDIDSQSNNLASSQGGLTIAQLLQQSVLKRRRKEAKRERRNKLRETPVAIYTGLLVHAKTRRISLFQNITHDKKGLAQPEIMYCEESTASTKVEELPSWYTSVTPASLPNKSPPISDIECDKTLCSGTLLTTLPREEEKWLESIKCNIDSGDPVNKDSTVSAASFHANIQSHSSHLPAISTLLPLFPDNAKSVAMITHAMNVIQAAVYHVNPEQVPVIALDQPLYAVAKQIQWNFKERYGEHKFVIMFGGLHIEMAFLKVIGNWLEESDWNTALVDANVASVGTADSFIKAASVTRTRRAHQITASCLYIMLQKEYDSYAEGASPGDEILSFEEWCNHQAANYLQFYYLLIALRPQLISLMFVRSLRQGNFSLYWEALSLMISRLFALNHTNYARWIPIHLRDMRLLPQLAPAVAEEFERGSFTVRKFSRIFSAIAIDHAHEQNNAMTRDGDVDDFFRHENQACPPSQSNQGNLRLPQKKSELDTTRGNRGAGVRRCISPSCPIPSNWSDFLRNSENKTQLFNFLDTMKQIITTYEKSVRCTVQRDTTDLSPCSHEEADSRVILHVKDAHDQGFTKIAVRTVDTDVLVLSVAVLPLLPIQPKLWVAFDTGANFRCIAAHMPFLQTLVSKCLERFRIFMPSQAAIQFKGKGKKTAFETWKLYPEVTDVFIAPTVPEEVSDIHMATIERFTVLLYDRTSSKLTVNEAKKQLFAQKGRPLEALPPSKAALLEHTKRAAYQAGHCWGQSLARSPVLPSPEHWGWALSDGKWEPYWTALPDVTRVCQELIRCGCKKGYTGRCSCQKVGLRCTALCSCDEECDNRT
ncbi:predicted protein [Nematostella vectensis]|uniref:Tesmin/TSO1-like CXC domain-containing protein n=1 Tax=Nematostella vectensis TaxID=45351 RepID=A7S873_NEMVE|nr:predicted protein [Nematostella vectensis]|eukprot:XP_001632203.1 predicted protein [Nematostella vectensis]